MSDREFLELTAAYGEQMSPRHVHVATLLTCRPLRCLPDQHFPFPSTNAEIQFNGSTSIRCDAKYSDPIRNDPWMFSPSPYKMKPRATRHKMDKRMMKKKTTKESGWKYEDKWNKIQEGGRIEREEGDEHQSYTLFSQTDGQMLFDEHQVPTSSFIELLQQNKNGKSIAARYYFLTVRPKRIATNERSPNVCKAFRAASRRLRTSKPRIFLLPSTENQ